MPCSGHQCGMTAVKSTSRIAERPVIGWREWLALPGLNVPAIKAKIDTGARSSSLHAFDIKKFQQDGRTRVRFAVHPVQRNTRVTVTMEADVLEMRRVRSSGGHETVRPVILTQVQLLGRLWEIELTLASRDTMGFRMLLGRQAVRERFLIDPGHSYSGEQPVSLRELYPEMSAPAGRRRRVRRKSAPTENTDR